MNRVELNLLPDVKLDYWRTQRTRNLTLTVCTVASIIAIAILIIMLGTVELVQRKQLNNSKHSLDAANSKLADVSDLSKIVTVQNQLHTLVGLHQNKHAIARIFDYLPQVTPSKASISRLDIDTTQNTMHLSGNADSQKTVNTFIDTLKYTTYKIGQQDSPHQAFSSVVESSFSISTTGVSYGLDFTYDPQLFANNLTDSNGSAVAPKLSVPSLTTTRSVLDDPSNQLFKKVSGDKSR